jgi:hypothetical protein
MESFENVKVLFIAGAPRSGTTLLSNLLDSHPDLLCFPMEHGTLERYFWNQNNFDTYAKTSFISSRIEGQQTILFSNELLESYKKKIKTEYGKDFELDVDSGLFNQNYLKYLDDKETTLKNVLLALGFALKSANKYSENKGTPRYIVFKQPYYTEVFANKVHSLMPDAKFIHILRSPLSRYVSAKKRHADYCASVNRKLSHINRKNYVLGHVELDISSRYLCRENKKLLGLEKYFTVNYEDMVKDSKATIDGISSWLGIAGGFSAQSPTRLGVNSLAGSTLTSSKEGLDKRAIERSDLYQKYTSWSERVLHNYYLSKVGLETKEVPHFLVIFLAAAWPLPNSSYQNLAFQYKEYGGLGVSKENLEIRLPKLALKGDALISGVT